MTPRTVRPWLVAAANECIGVSARLSCRSDEDSCTSATDRLYIPADDALRTRLLHECHDAPTAGHLGKDKTLEQVKRRFYWPGMDADILQYVRTCDACQRNKPSQQATAGLVAAAADSGPSVAAGDDGSHHATSEVPIEATTRSSCSCDKLTKMVHLVADEDEVTAPQLAEIFWSTVVRHHGLPSSIVSDRDPRFTGHFWRALWKCLGTQLTMSTAFHPQTDGQTERANRTLEEMLRSVRQLPAEGLGRASGGCRARLQRFEARVDRIHAILPQRRPRGIRAAGLGHRRGPNDAAAGRGSKNSAAAPRLGAAKEHLLKAQQRQAHHADKHRREVRFQVGDRCSCPPTHLEDRSAAGRSNGQVHLQIHRTIQDQASGEQQRL